MVQTLDLLASIGSRLQCWRIFSNDAKNFCERIQLARRSSALWKECQQKYWHWGIDVKLQCCEFANWTICSCLLQKKTVFVHEHGPRGTLLAEKRKVVQIKQYFKKMKNWCIRYLHFDSLLTDSFFPDLTALFDHSHLLEALLRMENITFWLRPFLWRQT